MPLTLRLLDRLPAVLAIDLTGIVPDRLVGMTPDEIARLAVGDRGRLQLGDCFAVEGSAADHQIHLHGDLRHVRGVAAGMAAGAVEVFGTVGRHAAVEMRGGSLRVHGSAGDWLACGMSAGSVLVEGSAGDHAAGCNPGGARGLSGGIVVVRGNVGHLAGERMRRGVLAVGGRCGDAVGFEMRAGTVVVAGEAGPLPGLGMARGSIICLDQETGLKPPGLGVSFSRGSIWRPPFLGLFARRLEAAGFPARWPSGDWQQWHGDILAGGRGEIFVPREPLEPAAQEFSAAIAG